MKNFSIGDKIEHKLFGEGIITDINGIFDSAKLTIEFEGKVSKVILAKYVKLPKVKKK